MTDETITLDADTKPYKAAVMPGSVGPSVADIRKFYGETGMFTYDPGFTSTASCQSAITYIDGDQGILLHRGYPIDQLAEQSTFMPFDERRARPTADAIDALEILVLGIVRDSGDRWFGKFGEFRQQRQVGGQPVGDLQDQRPGLEATRRLGAVADGHDGKAFVTQALEGLVEHASARCRRDRRAAPR